MSESDPQTGDESSTVSLDKLAETNLAAITKVDRNGNIVYANGKAEEVLGLQKSEITDRTYDDPDWKVTNYDGTDYPSEELPFEIVKETEEPVEDVKHAIERPDGKRRLLSVNAFPLFDDDGDFDGMVAVIEDVTDQYRSKAELEKERKRYRQLLTETNQGIAFHELIYDGEGNPVDYRILEINQNFESITGLEKEEVEGKKATEVYETEDPPYLDRYGEVATTGEPTNFETYYEPLDKHFKISVFSPKKGQFATVFYDITERKEAKEKLRESEVRLQGLFETMVEGMIFIAPDGQIVQANPAAERILGLKHSDIETRNYVAPEWEILRPDGTPMPPEEMAGPRAMKERRPVKNVVMGAKRPDDSIAWINASAAPLMTESGEFEGVVGTFADITERKQAKQTLQESEERLGLALEGTRAGLWDWNAQTGEIMFNERWAEIVGYELEELEPVSVETWEELVHPEDLERSEELLEKHFAGETDYYEFEGRMKHKNGDWVWILDRGRVVEWDDEGNPVRMVGTHIDITERKEAEEELVESEEKFRGIYEESPIGIELYDSDGELVDVNQACLDIFGVVDSEELEGFKLFEDPNLVEEHKKKLREGEIVRDEMSFDFDLVKEHGLYETTKSGVIVIDTTITPLTTGESQLGYLVLVRDITDRKRAEEKLKESEERYRTLTENTSFGIGISKGTELIFANKKLLDIFMVDSVDRFNEKPPLYYLTPESKEKTKERMKNLSQGVEVPENFEVDIVRTDGQQRTLELGFSDITIDGEPCRLSTYNDITERVKAEEELKESKEKLHQSFIELAETTSRVLGVRDPYTQKHEQRVAELATEVGKRMGLDEEKLLGLYLGGMLHDIGKIIVPETILTKPGDLKDVERELIRSHPEVGYNQILKDTDFPWPVAEMTLHHHERLDGSGYPDGLEGDEMSLEVRILATCDVVEAMSTRRPYREARSKERTLKVIKDGKGEKFDPEVVDILVNMIDEGEIEFGEE